MVRSFCCSLDLSLYGAGCLDRAVDESGRLALGNEQLHKNRMQREAASHRPASTGLRTGRDRGLTLRTMKQPAWYGGHS